MSVREFLSGSADARVIAAARAALKQDRIRRINRRLSYLAKEIAQCGETIDRLETEQTALQNELSDLQA